jgi:hypothetical protein
MAAHNRSKPPRPNSKPPPPHVPPPERLRAGPNQTPRILKEFNFSSASSRDPFVFGAQRPGHIHPEIGTPSTPRGPAITKDRIIPWIQFMRSNRIKRCICLLTQEELNFYDGNLLDIYGRSFTHVTHIPDIYGKTAMRDALEVLY